MFLKLMVKVVEILGNVLVLISQMAALNCSDTYNQTFGTTVKNTLIDIYGMKSDLNVLYSLIIFLIFFRIVEVFSKVLILVS